VNDVLQGKMVKRGISLKALSYGAIEPAAGGTVRQKVTLQQGIAGEKAKEIVKTIKKFKVKSTGIHPGRCRSCQRERPRRFATSDLSAEAE